jgi:hypothetical protein
MRHWLVRLLVAFLLVGVAFASEKVIPRNAKIYIEKMDEGLDGYIQAEFVKKSVPLQIVTKEEDADLVMTGNAANQKRSWHEGWLSPDRDHATGNVTIVERSTGKFLWASEAGDRSLWWGAMKRGGARKVADRIVNNLKGVIQSK